MTKREKDRERDREREKERKKERKKDRERGRCADPPESPIHTHQGDQNFGSRKLKGK